MLVVCTVKISKHSFAKATLANHLVNKLEIISNQDIFHIINSGYFVEKYKIPLRTKFLIASFLLDNLLWATRQPLMNILPSFIFSFLSFPPTDLFSSLFVSLWAVSYHHCVNLSVWASLFFLLAHVSSILQRSCSETVLSHAISCLGSLRGYLLPYQLQFFTCTFQVLHNLTHLLSNSRMYLYGHPLRQ